MFIKKKTNYVSKPSAMFKKKTVYFPAFFPFFPFLIGRLNFFFKKIIYAPDFQNVSWSKKWIYDVINYLLRVGFNLFKKKKKHAKRFCFNVGSNVVRKKVSSSVLSRLEDQTRRFKTMKNIIMFYVQLCFYSFLQLILLLLLPPLILPLPPSSLIPSN